MSEVETEQGNYFVSNYPPFSYWNVEQSSAVEEAYGLEPHPETPLGIYIHIPYCRKRCHFCYFKVYTDRSASEIHSYLGAVRRELEILATRPGLRGRKPDFLYFGGGTPSYLSREQISKLHADIAALVDLSDAREIAFECEPGTLTPEKLETIGAIGVNRLSLGVENFDEKILELNNRAHRGREIVRAWEASRKVGFQHINIDLIAGMVGETDENWSRCIERTLELEPESVTIYQMELPHTTTIARQMRAEGGSAPVADWERKRRWVGEAFARMEEAGYHLSSGYTAVRDPARHHFVYRDQLWRGADMVGLGVASFSHFQGVHYQNEGRIEDYQRRVDAGEMPVSRAYATNAGERLVRELVLQLKLGFIDPREFERKFGVNPAQRFASEVRPLVERGWMVTEPTGWKLTRAGLLRVDSFLPDFFRPEHRGG